MRRVVKDINDDQAGTIDPDECVIGTVGRAVVDDRMGMLDQRDVAHRRGSVTVTLRLGNAQGIAGRRVAIFLLEEL